MDTEKKEGTALPPRPRSHTNARRRGRSSRHSTTDSTACTESMHSGSTQDSRSRASNMSVRDQKTDVSPQVQLGFDSIDITPRRRGRSSSTHRSRPSNPSRSRSRSHSCGTRSQFSSQTPRRRKRSTTSSESSSNQLEEATQSNTCHRSRSHSAVRTRSSSVKRSRSNSHSNMTSINRSRSKSCSRGSRDGNFAPTHVEPNVHHDSIMTSEIEGPVIAEMKENELFARKAGCHYTKEGGDCLTLVDRIDSFPGEGGSFINCVDPTYTTSMSFASSEDGVLPPNAIFLNKNKRGNLFSSEEDLANLRTVAGQLCMDWRDNDLIAPTLARRLRDFEFAQYKRRKRFGDERPWGILGLYDHLAAVRMDVKWAEDAACKRANGEPYKPWFEFVDERKTGNNRPFFTYFVMTVCTGFIIASIAVNGWSVESFSINPMIGPSAETLVGLGAKESFLIVNDHEIWRLISAMVLHAGMIHYLLNMGALWFIGSAVEHCHGSRASILLFVAPAIGGTLLSAIFLPNYISVGASGGIFGLIGACLADIVLNWGLLFNDFVNVNHKNSHMIVLIVLFLDIMVNSLIGLTPFVDNFTHLGGMLFGFLCGTSTMQRVSTDMFGDDDNRSCWITTKRHMLRFLGIIVTLAGMLVSLILLLGGDGETSPCKACNMFSCVTFPPWVDYENKWWYCDDCGSATADAHVDPVTHDFASLTLQCPGGTDVVIDLEGSMRNDRSFLESNLPTFCRLECPDAKN